MLYKRQTYAMNFNHGTQSPITCFILQQDKPNDVFGYLLSGKKLLASPPKRVKKLKRKWKQLEILLTYANSIEQSCSWEANRFLESQEIPCILWSPKVHYCIHMCPPPLSVLSAIRDLSYELYRVTKSELWTVLLKVISEK